MWFILALLSAVFAALTSILAKVGIEGVSSNLATAIRTLVVLAMAWLMVFVTNTQSGITDISRKSWIFLIPVSYTHLDVYKRQTQPREQAHAQRDDGEYSQVPAQAVFYFHYCRCYKDIHCITTLSALRVWDFH